MAIQQSSAPVIVTRTKNIYLTWYPYLYMCLTAKITSAYSNDCLRIVSRVIPENKCKKRTKN